MFAPVSVSGPMKFHRLASGGYELLEDYEASSPLLVCKKIVTSKNGLVVQYPNGKMLLKKGFKCDGPSGPTVDTDDFMPAAFIHDGGYRLCRDSTWGDDWQAWRKRYDQVLHDICELKGMSWLRRQYVYAGVRLFASGSARPQKEPEDKIEVIP